MDKSTLITILLAVAIALLGIGIIVPVLPIYATRLGATGITLGLIVAAFSITRGILQPIVGAASDRGGRKGFLLAGLTVYTLVGLILPHAESVYHLILIRAFHGIGSAMIIPVAMAYMADLAPAGQEGRYMGLLNAAIFTGIGGGPIIGGIFTDLWGLSAAFYTMAGLSVFAIALVCRHLPDRQPQLQEKARLRLLATMGLMLGSRRTMGLLLARMAVTVVVVPSMAFLPLLMSRGHAVSGMEIGLVIASRTLVNAILQAPFGKLADRRNKIHMLVTGCLLISGAMFAVPFATGFWPLAGLFALMGLGESIVWPTLGALAAEEGRFYGQGAMMGVFNMSMSAGVFFGAMGAGIIMDLFGLQYAFFLIAVFVLGCTLVAAGLISNGRLAGESALGKPGEMFGT
jgi:MFS transporter, DHA1 family, multidrug resistance protein